MKATRISAPFPAWIRSISTLLAVLLGVTGLVPNALAGPIPSALITEGDARAADIALVQQALETKVVRHRLAELGFTAEEIQDRITFASNEELHQLAAQSETVMAGGDGGILITILLVVLLVLLILRISDVPSGSPDDLLA